MHCWILIIIWATFLLLLLSRGTILHPISCLVERQEGYSLTCFQCGCCCSSVKKMTPGRRFEKVLHDFQHFESVTDSSECFLYSVPEPLSSASLERHLQSAWHWRHVSTHELGAALWFQPGQVVRGECISRVITADWPTYRKYSPLTEIHHLLLFQGDGVKAVCINLCAVELS